jgi:hypothetical protein
VRWNTLAAGSWAIHLEAYQEAFNGYVQFENRAVELGL